MLSSSSSARARESSPKNTPPRTSSTMATLPGPPGLDASSAIFERSDGGRLSTTKKPRSSRHRAASERPAPEVLKHEQRLGSPRDQQGIRTVREVDLLEPLGETDGRDVETFFGEHLRRHRELPPAPVDHDQRGRVREPAPPRRVAVTIFAQSREPAPEHLLHAREVVLSGDPPDLEPPVVGSLRQSVFEHDHRADLVGRAEVRDVVALDPQWRLLEAEQSAELRQRSRTRAKVRGALQLVPLEVIARVLRDS